MAASVNVPELDAELEKQYQAALSEMRMLFEGNSRKAELYFQKLFKWPTFLKHSFFQARFKDQNSKTSVTTKLAVIAAYGKLPQNSLANQILKRIVRAEDASLLREKFDGFYRYWRYYPTQRRDLDPVRWGAIELRTDPNFGTKFNHWSYDEISRRGLLNDSPDWRKFTDPEDSGFAFYTRRRLFLMAFRIDNIRLAIAPLLDNPKTDVLNGIVITTRKNSGAVFAASFVLAHENNDITRKPMSRNDFLTYVKMDVKEDLYIVHD